jgi:Lon protease-like protein
MPHNPFDPIFENLPEIIPIFPLEGALLLPRGELPLNIFEPRYLAMVADALQGNRLIGIIQPDYKTGCVGRIVKFEESIDGRYLISLRGICRFHLGLQIVTSSLTYRRAHVSWADFKDDMVRIPSLDIDKSHLKKLLRRYFETQGLSMDWELVDEVADEGLLTALAMICPLPATEKQALLEAKCCKSRAELLLKLLEMSLQTLPQTPTTPH